MTNDFEESVFAAHPAIRAAKEELLAAGALYASMSGSGSAVFGLFDDPARAARLRERIPPEVLYVAESGVTGPADVAELKRIGADAVLMGEVLMRAKDRAALLAALREAAK